RSPHGALRPFMPDFTELSALARPLSLAFLAFVISWTPFFAALYGLRLTRPAADPQPLAWLLVGLAGLWGLIYTPTAVTVAALTERMGATLNPTLGICAIHRMGTVYWHALIIFTAIAMAEQLIGYVLSLIAPLKVLLGPLVKTYAALAIG